MTFVFNVAGEPRPFERAGRQGSRYYTPRAMAEWKKKVKKAAKAAKVRPLSGDVMLLMFFRRSTNQRADLDNLQKAVLDALNKVAYVDDKQVTEIRAYVLYASTDPGVSIIVKQTTPRPALWRRLFKWAGLLL